MWIVVISWGCVPIDSDGIPAAAPPGHANLLIGLGQPAGIKNSSLICLSQKIRFEMDS